MIKVNRYDTLEACMAAFFDCPVEELPTGRWTWSNGGRYTVWPMSRMIRNCRKKGVWGWCEDKREIHVWTGDLATPSAIVRMLAHELGHMQRPYRRNRRAEEDKAEGYATVAKTAFEIMMELMGGEND